MSDSELWPHQEQVFDLLMAGKNVILQAPTGSGKTRAALYPFLYVLGEPEQHRPLPGKCIYSVPMRVLANQFYTEYEQTVARYNRRYDLGLDIRTSVRIQTGEQPDDRTFEGDLIFATIDQTLSSFLIAPYGLPRRKANLNAGAVLASYLVFDEFHLYDPESMLPTTLHMLQLLNGITPFILMTATFSREMLDGLAKALCAEVVGGTPEEQAAFAALPSQDKTRRYHVADRPLSAAAVLEAHRGRSLAICNTVDRARWLYKEICDAKDPATEVILLHSRFLPGDRNRKEDFIRQRFGKDDRGEGSLIVVATQAIEVGLDITSTVLHTELAPASSIIQRAGRCARYPGDKGDVYIYQYSYDYDSDGNWGEIDLCEQYRPYVSQKELFGPTLAAFGRYSGDKLTFADEQAILSEVHGEQDRQIVAQLQSGAYEHRRNMFAVMNGSNIHDVSHLVRDVFQQQVTIHPDPDQLLESPFDAPSFGLHPGTLQGHVKRWIDRANELDLDWAVKYLYEEADPDQKNRTIYTWERVDNPKTAWGARLLVVNPALATYDPDLGFVPDRGGDWQAELPPRGQRSEKPQYTYHLETYAEHVQWVYEAFRQFWPELADAARRLEQHYGWPPGSVERAAELAVRLHDLGKLSVGWQRWVERYQQEIGEPVEKGQAYAHTESQTEEHRQAGARVGRRPTHAVEGASAALRILHNTFGQGHPLAVAAFSAIARHHAPHSASIQAFRLLKSARQHVASEFAADLLGVDEEIFSDFGAEDEVVRLGREADDEEAENDGDVSAHLAYTLIVRALRRADGEGTSRGAGREG